MPSLNTLRTRGGLIISIVIGVSLLAFILGDISSAQGMMNARKMKAGEIGGKDIGYMDYSQQVDYYSRIQELMSGNTSLTSQQQDMIKDITWEDMINKNLLSPGYEKLGLTVTEAEQIDMIDGTYISPVVRNTFINPNTGMFDPEMIHNLVANLGADNNSQVIWNYIKEQMNAQRQTSKYIDLVSKGFFVNDLEVAQGVDLSNSISNIAFVNQPYSLVADSLVKVSPSEISKYYKEHKGVFRQEASRDVEYVVFDVLPSADDSQEAEKYIQGMAEEFAQSENPVQYALSNSQTPVSQGYYSADQLPADLSEYAFGPNSKEMFGPNLDGYTYTLARVTDKKMLPDTLGARHILLDPEQKELADSIMNVLRADRSKFAALAQQFSADQAANLQGGDLGRFAQNQMVPEIWSALEGLKVGDLVSVNTSYGLHIAELTHKSPLKEKAQVAMITYQVDPSDYTQQLIYAKASDFASVASADYEAFKTAVTEGGLSKRVARIRNTERNISGMDNSREVVRWAFNAEKGDVSPIIEVNGDYIVAALAESAEDGYMSLESATPQITALLIDQKKGEILSQQMQGSSLSEIAAAAGLEIKEASGIAYNSYYADGIGAETKVIGAVQAVEPGSLSKPVAGMTGVYVFEVTGREQTDQTTAERERVRLEANSTSYIYERINQAVKEMGDIKDYRVKYF